jgi:L-threonylcarbamoyladenylate synthase
MDKFMPGPLTLVLNSKGVVCKDATAGGQTLAVRMPVHQACQKFLKEVDIPIVAPSANLSKHTSPVSAKHVYDDLSGKIELILDGGKCSGGIESTVLDCTGQIPRILRAGLITKEDIEQLVGSCEIAKHKEGDKVRSPGVKYTHYKPKCETALFEEKDLEKAIALYNEYLSQGKKPYIMCADYIDIKGYNILSLGLTEQEIASNLYDKLLLGEKLADIIIAIAMPNEKGINLGIMNRMRRACGSGEV